MPTRLLLSDSEPHYPASNHLYLNYVGIELERSMCAIVDKKEGGGGKQGRKGGRKKERKKENGLAIQVPTMHLHKTAARAISYFPILVFASKVVEGPERLTPHVRARSVDDCSKKKYV